MLSIICIGVLCRAHSKVLHQVSVLDDGLNAGIIEATVQLIGLFNI